MSNVFDVLNAINVNNHLEKKKSGGVELAYLSWVYAWAEAKSRYPDVSFRIIDNADGLPYFYDPLTGYMVRTEVTIEGITHPMWLPVMDGANKAMKSEPYEYTTRFGTKRVEAATMFDINTALMRCLTKNLGLFGIGLYVYAGEDLPLNLNDDAEKPSPRRTEPAPTKPEPAKEVLISEKHRSQIEMMCEKDGVPVQAILDKFNASSLDALTATNYAYIASNWSKEFVKKEK